jgi:tetratricopeptide (TPR) repeat protein
LVRLYSALADFEAGTGRCGEGLATTERAVAMARALGNDHLLAEALAASGHAHVSIGDLARAQRALEEAIPQAEAAGDLVESLPKALWLLSIIHMRYGELERGTVYSEQERAVTRRTGQLFRTVAAIVQGGLIAYVCGDWTRARRDGEQALALSQQIGVSWTAALPFILLGLICHGEGRWEEAWPYLEKGLAEAIRQGYTMHYSSLHYLPCVLATCELLEGRPERARARLAPLLDAADPGAEESVALFLPPLGWAQLELGEVAAAAETIARALAQARTANDRLSLVDALRVQSLVAMRQGLWDEAMQALDEGVALARSMPYPYAEARLLHVYGAMHLQKGEPEPARERLEAALTVFRRLGARREVERVEQAIAGLSAP